MDGKSDRPGRARVVSAQPAPSRIDNRSTSAAVVTAYCAHPQCRKEFRKSMGRGRPRIYCSDDCRRQAEVDARRISAQIQHHREMADMLARDLAAYETPTVGDAPALQPTAQPTAARSPGIEVAAARAEGVLVGLDDGSVLAREFARLLEAVRNAGNADGTAEYRAS